MEYASDAEVIAKLVANLHEPRTVTIDTGAGEECNIIALPKGLELRSFKPFIDEMRKRPERIKGESAFTDITSFIEHVNRFKAPPTTLFFRVSEPSLLAVYDYHAPGLPNWGEHRARYSFPISDEWTAWHEASDAEVPQAKFAQWIEDRILDVLSPELVGAGAKEFATQLSAEFATPARLMELSRGLTVRAKTKVANHKNLSTGETQFQFETEHQDERGEPLRVPAAFLIGIPVFEGGALYQIPVRLRYRVQDAQIVWKLVLYRTDKILKHASDEACRLVQEQTGITVLQGWPER